MVQQVKMAAIRPDNEFYPWNSIWWNKRTDGFNLSSDLHMCTIETCPTDIQKKMQNLIMIKVKVQRDNSNSLSPVL